MMCKNHDELHYSRAIREIADRLADGDVDDRNLLLQMWAYNGAAEMVQRHRLCTPPRMRVKVDSLGEAEQARIETLGIQELIGRLHDRWDRIAESQTPVDNPVDADGDGPPF